MSITGSLVFKGVYFSVAARKSLFEATGAGNCLSPHASMSPSLITNHFHPDVRLSQKENLGGRCEIVRLHQLARFDHLPSRDQ